MMPTLPRLILASQSPYRRALIEKLGLSVDCLPAYINEDSQPGESPTDLARRLAREKAQRIADQYQHALVIGSDQLAELDGNILGKPGTIARAKIQLLACSGRSVNFHTALCLLNSDTGHAQIGLDTVTVKFRQLTSDYVDHYLSREDVLDCAGSFKCEGLGICLFESIDSRDPNSLQGLPLIMLIDFLLGENFPLFT